MSLLTADEIYAMYREPSSDAEMLTFAGEVERAVIAKLALGMPELVDAARDVSGKCIVCGIRPSSIAAHVTVSIAEARVNALELAADRVSPLDAVNISRDAYALRTKLADEIRALKGTQ